jgi:hypothetical protein
VLRIFSFSLVLTFLLFFIIYNIKEETASKILSKLVSNTLISWPNFGVNLIRPYDPYSTKKLKQNKSVYTGQPTYIIEGKVHILSNKQVTPQAVLDCNLQRQLSPNLTNRLINDLGTKNASVSEPA